MQRYSKGVQTNGKRRDLTLKGKNNFDLANWRNHPQAVPTAILSAPVKTVNVNVKPDQQGTFWFWQPWVAADDSNQRLTTLLSPEDAAKYDAPVSRLAIKDVIIKHAEEQQQTFCPTQTNQTFPISEYDI